jgi:hypothetical protein
MSKILDRLTAQLRAKGVQDYARVARDEAFKAGNVDGLGRATPQGVRRGAMTPAQRLKARRERAK